ETGRAVKALEVPQGPIDRSMGDVHPSGNPHFWLSPSALAEAGTVIRDTLMAVAPESAAVFHERYAKMKQELTELQSAQRARLEGALARNAAPHAVEYHKEFTYFFDAYGIQSFGSIEEKPGVPP